MPSNSTQDSSGGNGSDAAAAAAAASASSSSLLPPTMASTEASSPSVSSNSPSSRPLTPAFTVQTTAAATASDSADDSNENGRENTQTEQTTATTSQSPSPSTANDAAVSRARQLSVTSPIASEEMLSLLSAKKRALLSEIGALLTLRERLQTEMRLDHEKGVPFDYAVRFAHSPSTLAALEAAAEAFRAEMRAEGIQMGKAQRVTASSLPMSPGVHASASAVAKSARSLAQPTQEPEHPAYSGALFDSSPSATPVQTPSKLHPKKANASAAPHSTAAPRPHTAPASRASSAISYPSPSVAAYPPIHEEEEPEEATSDLYNGIHAEESIYLDAIDGEEAELQQSLAHTYSHSPAPRSFLQSPMPNRAYVRPSTAAAASTPNTRHQPHLPQSHPAQTTHRDPPRSSTKYAVSSSRYSTPPHALYDSRPSTSSASRPSSRASNGSSDSPLGFLAQKALLKQQAEQETLASFNDKTLGDVAQEGRTKENKQLGDKLHYLHFNPNPHGAAHETLYRQSPAHSTTAAHHHPAQQQRHAPASPARTKPLQNITNSSAQRHMHTTPRKDAHSSSQQHTTTARGESFVRW